MFLFLVPCNGTKINHNLILRSPITRQKTASVFCPGIHKGMHHRLFSFGAADDGHNSCLIRQLQFQGSIVRFLLVQLETHNAPTVRCSFSANIKRQRSTSERQMQAAAFDNLEHDVSLVLVRLDQIVKAHRPLCVGGLNLQWSLLDHPDKL